VTVPPPPVSEPGIADDPDGQPQSATAADGQPWWRLRRTDLLALRVWAASRVVMAVISLAKLLSHFSMSSGSWGPGTTGISACGAVAARRQVVEKIADLDFALCASPGYLQRAERPTRLMELPEQVHLRRSQLRMRGMLALCARDHPGHCLARSFFWTSRRNPDL
jgi:hypothetical protein